MPSATIATVEKMLETLPEEVQERVVEHLREYILDLQDELRWDGLFKGTQNGLVKAAQRAKEEVEAGRAEPLDLDLL